jgi:hypothetical protein
MTTLGKHAVNVDIFTDAYRVTGRITVSAGGLVAELANPNSDYLDVEDVYVSRIHEPAKIAVHYSEATFRKSNVNFVVLQDRRDGIPTGTIHGASIYSRGRPMSVFLTVPAFEIQGTVIHEGKPVASAILVQSTGRFQSIFEAHASAHLYPDISYSGDLILVQKERIGIFCLDPNYRKG